jgi:hypothetical protein
LQVNIFFGSNIAYNLKKNTYQTAIENSTKSSKLRIINNSQIYSTIIDTMGQTFPVGILLLEETGVPEENHEPATSHQHTFIT